VRTVRRRQAYSAVLQVGLDASGVLSEVRSHLAGDRRQGPDLVVSGVLMVLIRCPPHASVRRALKQVQSAASGSC
jgi:hypothetical protein